MKTGFHYVVKAKLIRYKNANEIDFLEVEEKFENENPILAREAAFSFYQSYLDVLLESKDKKYTSDKQAREDLRSFIEMGTKVKTPTGEFDYDDSIGNGIAIFLIVDVDKEGESEIFSYKKNDDFEIHGIWYGHSDSMYGLENEYELYRLYNYDTKNKEREIVYCDADEWREGYLGNEKWLDGYREPNSYKILETPFDWTGFDEPYWWGEARAEEIVEEMKATKTIEDIIEGGEGNQVEFKPTLLYNSDTKKAGIGKKAIIARTICAFLNANGGYLLVGMNDDKSIRGLSNDFSLSNGKDPKDFFKLEFDEMIEQFISTSIMNSINADFHEIEEKEIFLVVVQPSRRRPIFFKGQEGKEFYVRKMASSKRINDVEEIANYCLDKWGGIPNS